MSGYPDNNPKTAFGAKKLPLELVPPAANAFLAAAFANGAAKYGPYNWREAQISSSVYIGAVKRHIDAWWDGEDLAPDSGVHHLAHAMACLAMIADTLASPMLNDNRPPKGPAARMQKEWIDVLNARGTSEGSGSEGAQGSVRVLAVARAKRARKARR